MGHSRRELVSLHTLLLADTRDLRTGTLDPSGSPEFARRQRGTPCRHTAPVAMCWLSYPCGHGRISAQTWIALRRAALADCTRLCYCDAPTQDSLDEHKLVIQERADFGKYRGVLGAANESTSSRAPALCRLDPIKLLVVSERGAFYERLRRCLAVAHYDLRDAQHSCRYQSAHTILMDGRHFKPRRVAHQAIPMRTKPAARRP